jgi:hypothetical protein
MSWVHIISIVMILCRNFIFKSVVTNFDYLRQFIKMAHIIIYMGGILYISMKIDTLSVGDHDSSFEECVVKDYYVLNPEESAIRLAAFKAGPMHKIKIYRLFENYVFNS